MKTGDPLVSVIMLSYNHSQYIEQALNSVLVQKTSFPFEVLIGDDNSGDGSQEILKKYKKKYPNIIRLFLHKENLGVTKNAYFLMCKARGKYLASCESDDFWTNDYKLRIQVEFLEAHSEFIGCTHPVKCVDKEGMEANNQNIQWISKNNVYTINNFRGLVLPGHSCSVVRRNIFLNPKYDYSVMWKANRNIGDRTSALLFAAQGDFYRFSQPMACYRVYSDGNSGSVTWNLYHNTDWINSELRYTNILDSYAKETFKINAGFEYYRRELLISGIWKMFTFPNKKNVRTIVNVVKSFDNPLLSLSLFPLLVIKKIIKKFMER